MQRRAADNGAASGATSPGAAQIKRFNQMILPHLDGAYNVGRYLTCDAVLSDDVVQDAMLRAYRSFGQFRGSSPRVWLFAIVRNCCRTAQAGGGGAVALVVHESALSEEALARVNEHPDPGPTPEQEVLRSAE